MLYMKEIKKQNLMKFLVELAVLASMLLMWFCPVGLNSYHRFETDTLHYVRAEVLEILSEELEDRTILFITMTGAAPLRG